MNSEGLVFILIGIFCLAAAGFDWDWFMNHREARFLTKILGGRVKAWIFYGLFGLGFLIFGVLITSGDG